MDDQVAADTIDRLSSNPALWIEVQIVRWHDKTTGVGDFLLYRQAVEDYLRANFVTLHTGQAIRRTEIDTEKVYILVNHFIVLGYSGPPTEHGFYALEDVVIQLHQWHAAPKPPLKDETADRSIQSYTLPNPDLAYLWKQLIFENGIQFRLLHYMARMTQIMRGAIAQQDSLYNWNRLCLLHGPPGGGKTTLCRALAQQLGIMFGGRTMLQVDCNELLSKYFGESAKQVTNVFDQVKAVAAQDHRLLVVILDEVESIASSRTRLSQGSENLDGLRATNALLKMLDDLQKCNNAIILCTTNMVQALDSAFLDRVDIKQYIGLPSPRVIYDFFRSSLNDMASRKMFSLGRIATPDPLPVNDESSYTVVSNSEAWQTPIASWDEMHVLQTLQPDSNASNVWGLSQLCDGMSGRTLRRLPLICLAMYTYRLDVSIEETIAALKLAARDELQARNDSSV